MTLCFWPPEFWLLSFTAAPILYTHMRIWLESDHGVRGVLRIQRGGSGVGERKKQRRESKYLFVLFSQTQKLGVEEMTWLRNQGRAYLICREEMG